MGGYDIESTLSAIRSAMISAIGKDSVEHCRALAVFDLCYNEIQTMNDAEILRSLGVIPFVGVCDRCSKHKD